MVLIWKLGQIEKMGTGNWNLGTFTTPEMILISKVDQIEN